jgi:hypothetical protein
MVVRVNLSPTIGPSKYRFTIEDYAQAREKYQPHKIKILFVAESPPSSGGYFYFSETIGKDHLFRETMKALDLWPLSRPMRRGVDKRPLLERFRSSGFFLIDTCELPVDMLSATERMTAICRGAAGLASRVRRLNPTHIVVVKNTVFRPVCQALEREGLGRRILNKTPLPFPSHGNQKKFRNSTRQMIRRGIQSESPS